jgi:hypothetical protein
MQRRWPLIGVLVRPHWCATGVSWRTVHLLQCRLAGGCFVVLFYRSLVLSWVSFTTVLPPPIKHDVTQT